MTQPTLLLGDLLQQAAHDRPEQTAVEDSTGVLTYRELKERVGRIASELREVGIQPGDRVGVLLPKSGSTVCVLYGILWAGASYVPLQTTAPAARLTQMIGDCEMRALVTIPPPRKPVA